MSDQPDCINVNNSIDNDIDIMSSSSPPRKKLKLSPNKTRTARLIPEKMHAPLTNYSWKFIDKNEAMMAELSGGKLTLWQFLLELLMSEEYSNLIKWTDRNIGEFILIQAEEVAKLWGIRKDRNHRMNYDKLSRALRYYYQKNIIKKVHGHKFVYRFVSLLPEMIPSSSSSHKSNNNCNNNISSTTTTTNTTSNTNGNSNGNSNQCESLNNNQSSSATEEDQISLDKCKSRSLCSSRNHQTLPNASRLPNKNLKKSDFNSTLSALFQAALLSLSGCNNDLSGGLFSSHKDSSDQCICSSDESINNPSSSRIFDLVNQNNVSSHHECICQPDLPTIPSSTTTGLFIPGSGCSASHIQPLPFDRQSLLHFSRHSINMQRLSQEIRLHSCNNSKSLLKPHLTNPLLSPSTESVDGIIDSSHPNFWLNQFAQDLFNSTSSSQNRISNPDKLPFTPPSQDEGDGSEVKIKTEKVNKPISSAVESENFNNLTSLFQKFIKDMESKNESAIAANDSIATISGISPHVVSEYCHLDLANLIKSQLETHSSFVWMPIPVKFAEEIMKYSIKSEPSDQSN